MPRASDGLATDTSKTCHGHTMGMCQMDITQTYLLPTLSYNIGLWTCSDSVTLFVFYGTLDLFQQCGIICFFILLLDFGTVPTVLHYFFFYWTLELFRQCVNIVFSFFFWTLKPFRQCAIFFFQFYMGLWKCSDSVTLLVSLFYFATVPKVWHVCFSIGLWTCSDSVALFVFLLDCGPVPTA